jgi:hypothetical protein
VKKRLNALVLGGLSALVLLQACQEEVANLDLLQATPVHAVLMVPVRDGATVSRAWLEDSPLPYGSDVEAMLALLPLKEGQEGLLSLHPVGAGTLHWAYTLRRGFTEWHPSSLQNLAPKRRDYSTGTIWEWRDSTGSWALAETTDWLVLSRSDILAEEGIRQVENQAGGKSYTGYPDLAKQLAREGGFVTLSLEDGSPVSRAWPPSEGEAKGLPDDLRSWRFLQPGSQAWTVRYTADSTAKVAVSEESLRSENLGFADSTEARTFPGWRWLTPNLVWAQWTAVDSRVNFKGQPTTIQAQGECHFQGRRKEIHRVTMRYAENNPLDIPHWMGSADLLAVNDLGLRKPLEVLPYVKTMGDFILTCEDTAAANRYMHYLPDTRDSVDETSYQLAIKFLRSQPSEGQIWWVSRQPNPQAPWAGLTYRAQGEDAYWSASMLVP